MEAIVIISNNTFGGQKGALPQPFVDFWEMFKFELRKLQ
jgi:hypothetical protein